MFHRTNVWQVLNNLPDQDTEVQDSEEQRQQQCSTNDNSLMGPDSHTLYIGSDESNATIPILPSLLLLNIVKISLLVMVFVIPGFHEILSTSTNAFSVLQYCYVVTWAVVSIVCWYVYIEFYHIWVLGYHHFHHSTKHLHAASFFLYTAGLVIMCILGTVVRDYCSAGAIKPCGEQVHLTPVNYQQIIVVIITLLSVGFNVKLVSDVYRFNQSGLPADVLVDDLGVRLSQATLYVNIGRPSNIHTVMEVQGSIINSLRNRVETLNRQIASLANTLEQYLDSGTATA